MKILMAGDCLGRPGRTVITEKLKDIRREYELDLVIANVENASGGFSITKKAADELGRGQQMTVSNSRNARRREH